MQSQLTYSLLPNKSHYTFNLRDMSKIFQGLCSANQKTTTQVVELIRLWIHENKRVFGDRMISQEDRDTLDELLNEEVINLFKLPRSKFTSLKESSLEIT